MSGAKITLGLDEALRHARGEDVGATLHTFARETLDSLEERARAGLGNDGRGEIHVRCADVIAMVAAIRGYWLARSLGESNER